jgi:hypothetical protein
LRLLLFFIFTSVTLVQSLQGFVTLVNWKINQDEITEKYCENKSQPMLNCNGKCYLSKQLKKQEEIQAFELDQNNKKIPTPKKIKEVDFCIQDYRALSNIFLFDYNSTLEIQFKNNLYSFEFNSSLFHPPQV